MLKKIIGKAGVILLLMLLLGGLFAASPVGAQDIQQADVTLGRTPEPPGYVLNCGASTVTFDWTIEFSTVPDEYHFFINDPDGMLVTPPGVIIGDMNGETSPFVDSYIWSVPAGAKTGQYLARVEYYSVDLGYESDAGQTFLVKQPLEVHKFNDTDGDGIWDAGESEITGTWNVAITNPSSTVIYNGTMPVAMDVMGNGTYTATENLHPAGG